MFAAADTLCLRCKETSLHSSFFRPSLRSGAGFVALFALIISFMTPGKQAAAFPPFLETAKSTYAFKPGGTLDKAGCTLCHAKPSGGEPMNLYGAAIKASLESQHLQTVTPEVLHSLDNQDSDNDGVTNGKELQADTLPGDPNSYPASDAPKSVRAVTPSPTTPATTTGASGSVNPFDIRAAMLARHAQHPVLVHFPIALFVISLFFDLVGLWKKNAAFHTAAYFNLAVAAISAVAAVATGLIAWQWLYDGEPLGSDQNLQLHLIFGSVSCVLLLFLWVIRYREQKASDSPLPPGRGYIVLALLTLATITLTGHLGGFVSNIPM